MSLSNEDKEWINSLLDVKLEHLGSGFDAKLERVETTLLTEFHKWASPTELRLKSHSAVLRVLDAEMEALADRVEKLEPPH